MRLAIGSDHAGFELKEKLAAYIVELGHEVADVGTASIAPVDYPDYAEVIGVSIREGRAEEGMVAAVRQCGELLAERFPARPDDTDELPDRIRT